MAALLKNFDTAEEVVKTSADSAGSALNENEKYLDSVNGKLQQLSSSFEELSATFLSSDLMKGLIDGGNSAIQVFTALTEKITSVGTALGTFALARSWINVAKGKQTGIFDVLQTPAGTSKKDSVMLFGHTVGEYSRAFNQLKTDMNSTGSVAGKIKNVFGSIKTRAASFGAVKFGTVGTINSYNDISREARQALGAQISAARSGVRGDDLNEYTKATKEAQAAQKSFVESVRNSNSTLSGYFQSLNGAKASLSGYQAYCQNAGKSMELFGIKSKAAAVGLKALSVAGSTLTAALSGFAIGWIITGITALVTHSENARQAAADAAQEYSESAASLEEYRAEVASIKQELASGSLSSDEAHTQRQRLLEI